MATTDPRLLINALTDLREECSRWMAEARESMDEAEFTQRHREDAVRQAYRRALIVQNEAEEDRERVERAVEDVARHLDQCEEARNTAADLLHAAQEALELAQHTLQVWQEHLDEALQWLWRAQRRLQVAEAELANAQWEFQAAESALEDAIWALRNCQNDERRRNCLAEQTAVAAAQAQLEIAQHQLEVAVLEVYAAREEVQQAEERVACCRRAVDYAERAVQVGLGTETGAQTALSAAEASLEYALAAKRMTDRAQESAELELHETEQVVIAARQAERSAEEAERSWRRADSASQSAQRLLTGSRLELEAKIKDLVELNRPILETGSPLQKRASAASSVSMGGKVGTRKRSSPNPWIKQSTDINKRIFASYHPAPGQLRVSAGDKYPDITIHANGDVIGPYKHVREMYRNFGLTSKDGKDMYMEAHHLLHKSITRSLGLDPDMVPSVGLYWTEHRGQGGHPFGTKPITQDDLILFVEDALDQWNESGYDNWIRALKEYIRANEARIRSIYGNDDRIDDFFTRIHS